MMMVSVNVCFVDDNTNTCSFPSHLSHLPLSPPLPLLPLLPFSDIKLSFQSSYYKVNESQPTLSVNIVKEPRDAETEIRYQFSVMATDVTANAPDDYKLQNRLILSLILIERTFHLLLQSMMML